MFRFPKVTYDNICEMSDELIRDLVSMDGEGLVMYAASVQHVTKFQKESTYLAHTVLFVQFRYSVLLLSDKDSEDPPQI